MKMNYTAALSGAEVTPNSATSEKSMTVSRLQQVLALLLICFLGIGTAQARERVYEIEKVLSQTEIANLPNDAEIVLSGAYSYPYSRHTDKKYLAGSRMSNKLAADLIFVKENVEGTDKFYLKQKSTKKYLGAAGATGNLAMYDNKDDANVAKFSVENVTSFTAPDGNNTAQNPNMIRLFSSTHSNHFLNNQGGEQDSYLPKFAGGKGGWSLWNVSKAKELTWAETAENLLNDTYKNMDASYLGSISAEQLAALIAEAKKLSNDGNGDEVDALLTKASSEVSHVEAGVYYTFISAYDKYKEIQGTTKSIYAAGNTASGELRWGDTSNSAAEVFQFEGTDDNGMILKSINANMYAGSKPSGYDSYKLTQNDPKKCTVVSLGSGQYRINVDGENALHTVEHNTGTGQSGAVGYFNGVYPGNASAWRIKKVTSINVKIGEAGYATLCLPFAVTIPSGVTAYTGKQQPTAIVLTAVTGTTIPANTAVILQGDAATYTFTILKDDKTLTIADNDLKGVTQPMNLSAGNYLLAQPEGKDVGFFKMSANGDLGPNKAYLSAQASGAEALAFDWNSVTAIEQAAATTAPVQYYDLNGRLVTNPTTGIYVTSNGQKVFIQK